jgi:hypothetical protein
LVRTFRRTHLAHATSAKTTAADVDPSLDVGGWFEAAIPLRTAASLTSSVIRHRRLHGKSRNAVQEPNKNSRRRPAIPCGRGPRLTLLLAERGVGSAHEVAADVGFADVGVRRSHPVGGVEVPGFRREIA